MDTLKLAVKFPILKVLSSGFHFEVMALIEMRQWLYCEQIAQKNKLVTMEAQLTGADNVRVKYRTRMAY